jgi:hypothetical protein
MYDLAGEIMTGEPAETYKSPAMARGNTMEQLACDYYSRTNFAELTPVGFIRRTLPSGIIVGCSPDRLIKDTRGVLEIKTEIPRRIIHRLKSGSRSASEHAAQCQGIMWVADLEWVDLLIYYRGMPAAPKFRIERDESYIAELSNAVEVFAHDLKMLVREIRSMGKS